MLFAGRVCCPLWLQWGERPPSSLQWQGLPRLHSEPARYALVLLQVMAHLQCEGFRPDMSAQHAQQGGGQRGWRPPPPRPADLQQTLAFLQQLAAGALPAMSEAAAAAHAAGRGSHMRFGDDGQEGAAPSQHQPQADLGVLLWGFFDRFGEAGWEHANWFHWGLGG